MTAPAEGGRDGAFMRIALGYAVAAGEGGEVPVGAVLVRDIPADSAVVFDGRPDADVDCGEHGTFGNH